MKRRVRQSLFDFRHPCGWLQSARTPPPAFPFLHDQLVKEQTRSLVTTSGPHLKGQTRQRVPFRFEFPAKNRGQEQKCRARLGRRGVSASRQGCFYRSPPLVSTPDEQKVQNNRANPPDAPFYGLETLFHPQVEAGEAAIRVYWSFWIFTRGAIAGSAKHGFCGVRREYIPKLSKIHVAYTQGNHRGGAG